MNKRIKQLAKRAEKFAKENKTQTIATPGNNYFELFHEKFAELIVKDCAEMIDSSWRGRTVGANTGFTLGDELKEHFGVEK